MTWKSKKPFGPYIINNIKWVNLVLSTLYMYYHEIILIYLSYYLHKPFIISIHFCDYYKIQQYF